MRTLKGVKKMANLAEKVFADPTHKREGRVWCYSSVFLAVLNQHSCDNHNMQYAY